MTTSNHASAGTQVYGYNHANQRVFVRNGNTVTDDPEGLGGERLENIKIEFARITLNQKDFGGWVCWH